MDDALDTLKKTDIFTRKTAPGGLPRRRTVMTKTGSLSALNGEPTYFCSDIAYVPNKEKRGYNKLIDIWGADHHGYIIRIHSAMKFLGYNPKILKSCFSRW